MKYLSIRLVVAALVALCLLPAALAQDTAPAENLTTACIESYEEGVDYFPEEVTITYAQSFSVEYFDNYKLVSVIDPTQEGLVYEYLLVQCGTPAPTDEYPDAAVIEVPVDSIVTTSTTYLPALDQLGLVDSLVAVDSLAFPFNEAVRERIDAGEVAEIGSGENTDVERLLELDPDLVMTSPFNLAGIDLMQAQEIPVVVNLDYTETNPLGRAEWSKFMALFFNQEAEAETEFEIIAERYEELAALTNEVEERPTVLLSTPYEGTWYMAAGDSYTAQILEDAGADYVYAETEGNTLFLDVETVFDDAADADFWLNPDQLMWFTLEDMLATDPRFEDFAAFQTGSIYNNNARLNDAFGNDYFESAAANPHLVLADLVAILHPELLPDHALYYYQPLSE